MQIVLDSEAHLTTWQKLESVLLYPSIQSTAHGWSLIAFEHPSITQTPKGAFKGTLSNPGGHICANEVIIKSEKPKNKVEDFG